MSDLHNNIDHCIWQGLVFNGIGICWGSWGNAANGLYDIQTYAHTDTEETAAVPTIRVCFLGDYLAQHWPCDNVPFYFIHKSHVV